MSFDPVQMMTIFKSKLIIDLVMNVCVYVVFSIDYTQCSDNTFPEIHSTSQPGYTHWTCSWKSSCFLCIDTDDHLALSRNRPYEKLTVES